MDQILFEVGKGKFHHWKVVDTEMKILTVLEYRILGETLTDRVFTLLDQAMTTQVQFKNIEFSQRKELQKMLSFVSKCLLHDFKLCNLPL
jgi:hypothetical protein